MKIDVRNASFAFGKSRCKVFLILFIVLSVGLLPTISKAQSWYNNSWGYRKMITIDYTKVGSGPHTNFPVLISRTDTELKNRAQASANDVLFTSSDGTTKLAHEIESYTSATGAIVAWVQIPSLSSSANTVIYMYYGNAAAANQQNVNGTWNTNYKGVWHLNGAFTDATSNGYTGTNTGTTNATGKISNGRGYLRSDGIDYIRVTGLMGSPTSFTLSAWATLTTADPLASDIISIGDDAVLRYDENGASKTDGVAYNGGSVWTTTASGINYAGTGWHYVVYTFDDAANSQKVYVDGVQVASTTSTASPSYVGGGANTFIGTHGNGNANMDFDGTIDEARISNASRSAGWVFTEYNNQNSPSTFCSTGNEEALKIFTGVGNFGTAARWTGSTLPLTGDYLIIDGTCTVDNNVSTDNIAFGPLVIGTATGRVLNWAASGTNRLNVSNVRAGAVASTLNMANGGTLITRGTITSTNLTFTPGTGTVEVQATITLPSAYTSYNNLTVNSPGITTTLSAATTTVTGNILISSGTLDASNLNITLSGNWSNSGTFTSGTGTVTFSGGTSQTITQAGSGNFYNVTINKSANDVTLINSITATHTFTLTARSMLLGTNNLTIGSSGSISGGSSTSFIVTSGTGTLIQNNIGSGGRTGGILFPVGATAASYTPATVNNTAGTADAFSLRVLDNVYQNGTTGATITAHVVKKTWMISETVAGGSSATLTAQWNGADEGTSFLRTACGISHYTGSAWDIPTSAAAAGSNPYSISRTGITSFSPFAVEENTLPLPVTLLYFNVNQENGENTLRWATASERNNKGFQIEKSFDGILFKSIGFVDGEGDSKTKIDYTFIDPETSSKASYYRLKQIDWDDQFEYSRVIYAPPLKKGLVTIYPNPVTESINIIRNEDLTQETNVSLEVLSDKGGTVILHTGILKEANEILNERIKTLTPGVYFIKIKSHNQDYIQKFVKL